MWAKVAVGGGILATGALLAVPAVLIGAAGVGSQEAAAVRSCPAPTVTPVVTTSADLDTSQLQIAGIIIGVAQSAGLGPRGAVVGLMAGMQESKLKNAAPGVGGGGSVGVFQQIAADGWGTVADELNPTTAAEMFFGVSNVSHNTGLKQVPGWQQMPPGRAAQAVQRSAFPTAYDKWEPLAEQLVTGAHGTGPTLVVDNCQNFGPGGNVQIPAGVSLPGAVIEAIDSAPAPIQTAIAYALNQVGKPYVWGGTGPAGFDCSGLVQAAYAQAGVSIPRTSEAQHAALPAVTGPIEPGDLVFSEGNPPGHVVMALGAGWQVEAAHTGTNIRVVPLPPGATGVARVISQPKGAS